MQIEKQTVPLYEDSEQSGLTSVMEDGDILPVPSNDAEMHSQNFAAAVGTTVEAVKYQLGKVHYGLTSSERIIDAQAGQHVPGVGKVAFLYDAAQGSITRAAVETKDGSESYSIRQYPVVPAAKRQPADNEKRDLHVVVDEKAGLTYQASGKGVDTVEKLVGWGSGIMRAQPVEEKTAQAAMAAATANDTRRLKVLTAELKAQAAESLVAEYDGSEAGDPLFDTKHAQALRAKADRMKERYVNSGRNKLIAAMTGAVIMAGGAAGFIGESMYSQHEADAEQANLEQVVGSAYGERSEITGVHNLGVYHLEAHTPGNDSGVAVDRRLIEIDVNEDGRYAADNGTVAYGQPRLASQNTPGGTDEVVWTGPDHTKAIAIMDKDEIISNDSIYLEATAKSADGHTVTTEHRAGAIDVQLTDDGQTIVTVNDQYPVNHHDPVHVRQADGSSVPRDSGMPGVPATF